MGCHIKLFIHSANCYILKFRLELMVLCTEMVQVMPPRRTLASSP